MYKTPLLVAVAFSVAGFTAATASTRADDEASAYTAYLSGRFAADEHDMSQAAKFYTESLGYQPDDPTIQALAFFYSTSAGDVDEAAKLAKRLVTTAPDDRASRLVLAITALKKQDYKEARDQIGKSAKGSFTSLTVTLVDAWAAAGAGDAAGAAADLKALRAQSGMESIAAFHQALILDYLGQVAAADTAYSDALKLDGPTPRIVRCVWTLLGKKWPRCRRDGALCENDHKWRAGACSGRSQSAHGKG
ncbi:MAG: tetratricopeptide repeat protein [Rhizomicrobium sp.]